MKLFVLGASRTGKTPLARKVAEELRVPHVSASEWVRRLFPPLPAGSASTTAERQQLIETMTRFSIEALKGNPLSCVDYLERTHDMTRAMVIEGMRNPSDFVRTFDPRTDLAVLLEHETTELVRTDFETGLDVIRDYLAWLVRCSLMPAERVRELRFQEFSEIDDAVAGIAAFARPSFPTEPEPGGRRQRVHAEIEPMALEVRKSLLFGNDPRFADDWVSCRAFVFSSYPGSAPTFQVLVDDGAVFSYVPPHHLRTRAPAAGDVVLEFRDLAYHNCPDGDLVVNAFPALRGTHLALFKHRDLWLKVDYAFTVDWYRGNDLLHCLVVENGQVGFLPHHKIKFHGTAAGFAPYKKLRNDWVV